MNDRLGATNISACEKLWKTINILSIKLKGLRQLDVCLYYQTSNISRILVGNKLVDHSDVVGASPVGAASTTSSFPTWHLALMDRAKTSARRIEKHLSFVIWCTPYQRTYIWYKISSCTLASPAEFESFQKIDTDLTVSVLSHVCDSRFRGITSCSGVTLCTPKA